MLCNNSKDNLEELTKEYREILEKLDKLEQDGAISAFDKKVITELSWNVIKQIAQNYENIQKGIGDIMVGPVFETEAKRILNRGISQGKNLGINEAREKTAIKMLKNGKLSIEEIAECSELSVEEVEKLAGLQKV